MSEPAVLTTANEVYYLDPVVFVEAHLWPVLPTQDRFIQFNGYSLRRQGEMLKKLLDAGTVG